MSYPKPKEEQEGLAAVVSESEIKTITCPGCNQKFLVLEEEQVPGFRCKDSLMCPYCNYLLRTSMSVEWMVIKQKDEEVG